MPSSPIQPAALEVSDVSKRFGNLQALRGVSATFFPGEVHAVLGENGAGKSTLMGVLGGFVNPDSGTVTLAGDPLPLGNPQSIRKRGVEMIHQHFMLVPAFSALENLRLSQLSIGSADSGLRERAQVTLAKFGWEIPLDIPVEQMSVGVQQRLEILKALLTDAQVMIFDEPTAVLDPKEVEALLELLRNLKAQGKIVILIAHKLQEVLAVGDRFTVLRKGEVVASAERADVDAEKLANWMVGDLPTNQAKGDANFGEIALDIQNLFVKGDRGEERVSGVTFQVRSGEILGIGGVDGNGQTELIEAILGLRPVEAGAVKRSEEMRVAYVPQDRHRDGLILDFSVIDNLVLGAVSGDEVGSGPFLSSKKSKAWTKSLIERFGIKAENPGVPVKALSGGNQQKAIIARNLYRRPDLLVVANPTRGLDVRATVAVHKEILTAAAEGTAVLLVSTDLDELFALSHKVMFLNQGLLREGEGASAVVGGAST